MMEVGTMVRANGSQMKLVQVHDGVGKCLHINHDGRIEYQFHYLNNLQRVTESMQPRSLWAETSNFDLVEIENEEKAAADARRKQRRDARKAKRSNKIKRTKVAA